MPNRTLLEAYAGILVAIVIVMAELSWWVQAALLLVLISLVIDISFHAPLMAPLALQSKIIVCLLSTSLILFVGVRAVADQYHIDTSHEDLRASFYVEMKGTSSFSIEYMFVNNGGAGASIGSIGLVSIVANNRSDEPSANANLCERANPIRYWLGELADRTGLSEVANRDVTKESHAPKDVMVDGAAWPAGAPIEIAPGKERTVSAAYELDPSAVDKYNILALCPTVEARDDIGVGGTAVCRGLLSVRTDVGLVAVRAAQRVRILPRTRDPLCPPAA
jgi:hypothetical protein